MERGDGGVRRRETQTEGWKIKLQSEKGRQLVAGVFLSVQCSCGSWTVMSRKEA